MALNGTLRSWNDERGFGFIAPRDGGREIFVHASAFPRDGSRPTVGESLTYELGPGKDGKPQAMRVRRQALGRPTDPARMARRRPPRKLAWGALAGALLVVALGAYAVTSWRGRAVDGRPRASEADTPATTPAEPSPPYRCDGRTRCSQMTSCEESKFFLRNCPDTKMDGDHDGVPCEQQWCTGPLGH